MAGIFVSYRRDDTQGWAGRLARALQGSFPKTQVFYDIATLQPGEDFPVAIDRALSSCQAALVLIGPPLAQRPDHGRAATHRQS